MATLGIKMRVFVPKSVFNDARMMGNIQHLMIQKTAPDLRREFEKTVRTWKDQPNFKTEHYSGVRVMWVKVYTYSTVYRLVNAGAAPHLIRPRRARMLRFQKNFRPKTRPRLIGSFAGGKFGDFISTPAVFHPGFEAREFDQTIAEEYQDTFAKDVQDVIKEGIVHA